MRLRIQKSKVEISLPKILLASQIDCYKMIKFDIISFYFGLKLNKQFKHYIMFNEINYVL